MKKFFALLVMSVVANLVSAQPLDLFDLSRLTLTYDQSVKNVGDRLFTDWRFNNSHSDVVWLKPNQRLALGRQELHSMFSSDRFRYQPDIAFGIGDGLFGATTIHGSTWTGRTQPRYVNFNLFGIIPLGRVRVNGG